MADKPTRNLDEIVSRAAALGPRERLAYLKDACGNETDLLLALQRVSAGWFAMEDTGSADEIVASADHDALDSRQPGELIGPWRIVRTLGRGGMGEVYLCERADQQFDQKVAIKLVSRTIPSRQIQTRLRTERQILARLDHPNIARLLDGGATADGVPYLVMEYVNGEPIDAYCDQRQLGIAERLQLFRTVCSAVHAAHRSLIVHRDLKPSNILVTADGGPKLLDFGIAKLLDVRQSSHTVAMTQADIRIMTPDHASPEQVRGEPITTASDVYVLGVLLFELLTGQRPFNVVGLRLSAIERVICEEDPPLPSHVVGGSNGASTRGQRAAADRKTTPAKLRRQLQGDLDNIVTMAMRKEPDRRYASAEQLSTDVDLHLRGMPVLARRDTWGYRADKFVRRHMLAVGSAAAFFVLLSTFAVTTYLQANQIRAERDTANEERARAERVSNFLVDIFRRSDPSEARGRDPTASEILDRGARRIDAELADEPSAQATLLDAIGRVYLNLDRAETAVPILKRSRGLRERLYGPSDAATAQSEQSLGDAFRASGDFVTAEKYIRRALDKQVAALGPDHEDVTRTRCSLGLLLREKADYVGAEPVLRDCLSRYLASAGERDSRTTSVMHDLASVLMSRGDYSGAEKLYRPALAIDRELLGADHPQFAIQSTSLAMALGMQGKYAEADPLFRESLETMRRVLGPAHQETLDALTAYGRFLMAKGDLVAAEAALREAVEVSQTAKAPAYAVGYNMVGLAMLLYERGEYQEAEALYRRALDIYRTSLEPDNPYIASALTLLARIYADRGDVDRVATFVNRAIGIWQKQLPEDHWQIASARSLIGYSLLKAGRSAESEPILLASYAQLDRQRGADDQLTRRVKGWLFELYDKWGKSAEAERYRVASKT